MAKESVLTWEDLTVPGDSRDKAGLESRLKSRTPYTQQR